MHIYKHVFFKRRLPGELSTGLHWQKALLLAEPGWPHIVRLIFMAFKN